MFEGPPLAGATGSPPSGMRDRLRGHMREMVDVDEASVRSLLERCCPEPVDGIEEDDHGVAGGVTFFVDAGDAGYVLKIAPEEFTPPPGPGVVDGDGSGPPGGDAEGGDPPWAGSGGGPPGPEDGGDPPGPDHAEALRSGAVICRHVGDLTDVPVPTVVALDASATTFPHPYLLMERLPGYNPADRYRYLPRERRLGLVRAVGRALGTVHETFDFEGVGDLAVAGERRVEAADPGRTVVDAVADHRERLRAGAEETPVEHVADRAAEAVEANLEALERAPGPTLLHNDLRPGNVLAEDGALTGVLDWDLATAGDPAWGALRAEWFFARGFRTPSIRDATREAFYAGYRGATTPDPWFARRQRLYEVLRLTGVGHRYRFESRTGSVDDDAFAAEAESDLEEGLAALEATSRGDVVRASALA